jgi:hypothetical protein
MIIHVSKAGFNWPALKVTNDKVASLRLTATELRVMLTVEEGSRQHEQHDA